MPFEPPQRTTAPDAAATQAPRRRAATARLGNRATGALIRDLNRAAPPAEPGGLRVRPAYDRFEREAHAVADRLDAGRSAPVGDRAPSAPAVQRLSGDPGHAAGGHALDGPTQARIRRGLGHGRPLPRSLRASLEPRLGVDLSPIRVRADREAHDLTASVGAQAMTVGRTIWFGEGRFAPESRAGRSIIHHEVAHALQQSGVRGAKGGGLGTMGTPTAPAVQRLMTAADVKVWGGDPSFAIRGKKYYSKILSRVTEYHRTRSTRSKRRILMQLKAQCAEFIKARGTDTDKVKARKVAAVRDLADQVAYELGERTDKSDMTAAMEQREQTRATGVAGLPDRPVRGTKYMVNMHAHIGHKYYTKFAKKRAWKRAGNELKLEKYKKTNNDMKREAATEVADEYTAGWDKSTFTKMERSRARRAFIDDLLSADVGHAWVSFHTVDSGGTPTAKLSFGLWPRHAPGFRETVPGDVHHPDARYRESQDKTKTKTVEVSFRNWKRGLTAAYDAHRRPPPYNLLGSNCTTFARDMSRAAGVRFPSSYWVAPDASTVWNPNDMFDAFEAEEDRDR